MQGVQCSVPMGDDLFFIPFIHGTAWRINTPVSCSSQSCLSGTDSTEITDMLVFKGECDGGAATPCLPGCSEPKTTWDGSELAHLSFLLEISSGS